MSAWQPKTKTALLMTESGEKFYGYGLGATGDTVAEVCHQTQIKSAEMPQKTQLDRSRFLPPDQPFLQPEQRLRVLKLAAVGV